MKKIMKAVLILMSILTAIYVSAVVYTNVNLSYSVDSGGKKPIDYGIWRAYFAEKLETEPQEWNTTEELGIMFGERVKPAEKETYRILIVDPEKALPWMKDVIPEPDATKYEDDFYNIAFLWVTPGLPERVKQWQIPLGVALGVCWVFTGVFLKGRKKE